MRDVKKWNLVQLAWLLPLLSPSQVVISAEPVSGQAELEQIVVIGEKTTRSLKETLSSVSVITEDDLSLGQSQTIRDAISGAANLVALTGAVPDIRGVSGNGSAGGFNSIAGGAKSRVSTLVDGVLQPFVADLTGDSGLWDIEQVEVYKGPQSTNNGQNSLAGSIYIKTKDPEYDWGGAARVGYRDKDSYVDTAAMLTGPISDTVAFRVAVQYVDGESYTNDQSYEGNPATFDLNGSETKRLHGKLRWEPSEDLDVLFAYATNDEVGETGRRYFLNDGSDEYNRLFYRNIDTSVETTSIKLNYAFNDAVSVEMLAAYMDYGWGFDTYDPSPTQKQTLLFDEQSVSFDTRVRYASDLSSLSGFLGLAIYDREQVIDSVGSSVYAGDDESFSSALYGELNYAMTPAVSLVVGARLQKEEQDRDFVYPPISATLDQDTTVTLPKIALKYHVSDTLDVFASVREGYNAAGGALNFTTEEYYYYDEETVTTYELGLRKSSQDGGLNLGINAFYNEYEGYQALSSTRFITNMDDVVSYGVEFELISRPSRDLELKASLGLLETEIKNAGVAYSDATGNELNSAPGLTASAQARYQFNDSLSASVAANYVDEYYGDFLNTETRVAGGYTLAKANAEYETEHWRFVVYVNNLFDEQAVLTEEPASGRYPDGYFAIADPRNIGVSVTYRF